MSSSTVSSSRLVLLCLAHLFLVQLALAGTADAIHPTSSPAHARTNSAQRDDNVRSSPQAYTLLAYCVACDPMAAQAVVTADLQRTHAGTAVTVTVVSIPDHGRDTAPLGTESQERAATTVEGLVELPVANVTHALWGGATPPATTTSASCSHSSFDAVLFMDCHVSNRIAIATELRNCSFLMVCIPLLSAWNSSGGANVRAVALHHRQRLNRLGKEAGILAGAVLAALAPPSAPHRTPNVSTLDGFPFAGGDGIRAPALQFARTSDTGLLLALCGAGMDLTCSGLHAGLLYSFCPSCAMQRVLLLTGQPQASLEALVTRVFAHTNRSVPVVVVADTSNRRLYDAIRGATTATRTGPGHTLLMHLSRGGYANISRPAAVDEGSPPRLIATGGIDTTGLLPDSSSPFGALVNVMYHLSLVSPHTLGATSSDTTAAAAISALNWDGVQKWVTQMYRSRLLDAAFSHEILSINLATRLFDGEHSLSNDPHHANATPHHANDVWPFFRIGSLLRNVESAAAIVPAHDSGTACTVGSGGEAASAGVLSCDFSILLNFDMDEHAIQQHTGDFASPSLVAGGVVRPRKQFACAAVTPSSSILFGGVYADSGAPVPIHDALFLLTRSSRDVTVFTIENISWMLSTTGAGAPSDAARAAAVAANAASGSRRPFSHWGHALAFNPSSAEIMVTGGQSMDLEPASSSDGDPRNTSSSAAASSMYVTLMKMNITRFEQHTRTADLQGQTALWLWRGAAFNTTSATAFAPTFIFLRRMCPSTAPSLAASFASQALLQCVGMYAIDTHGMRILMLLHPARWVPVANLSDVEGAGAGDGRVVAVIGMSRVPQIEKLAVVMLIDNLTSNTSSLALVYFYYDLATAKPIWTTIGHVDVTSSRYAYVDATTPRSGGHHARLLVLKNPAHVRFFVLPGDNMPTHLFTVDLQLTSDGVLRYRSQCKDNEVLSADSKTCVVCAGTIDTFGVCIATSAGEHGSAATLPPIAAIVVSIFVVLVVGAAVLLRGKAALLWERRRRENAMALATKPSRAPAAGKEVAALVVAVSDLHGLLLLLAQEQQQQQHLRGGEGQPRAHPPPIHMPSSSSSQTSADADDKKVKGVGGRNGGIHPQAQAANPLDAADKDAAAAARIGSPVAFLSASHVWDALERAAASSVAVNNVYLSHTTGELVVVGETILDVVCVAAEIQVVMLSAVGVPVKLSCGLHFGPAMQTSDPMQRRSVVFSGPAVSVARTLAADSRNGCITVSERIMDVLTPAVLQSIGAVATDTRVAVIDGVAYRSTDISVSQVCDVFVNDLEEIRKNSGGNSSSVHHRGKHQGASSSSSSSSVDNRAGAATNRNAVLRRTTSNSAGSTDNFPAVPLGPGASTAAAAAGGDPPPPTAGRLSMSGRAQPHTLLRQRPDVPDAVYDLAQVIARSTLHALLSPAGGADGRDAARLVLQRALGSPGSTLNTPAAGGTSGVTQALTRALSRHMVNSNAALLAELRQRGLLVGMMLPPPPAADDGGGGMATDDEELSHSQRSDGSNASALSESGGTAHRPWTPRGRTGSRGDASAFSTRSGSVTRATTTTNATAGAARPRSAFTGGGEKAGDDGAGDAARMAGDDAHDGYDAPSEDTTTTAVLAA